MIPVVNPMKAKGPLREGDPVIFLDRKDREYLFRLDRSHPISIRGGKISADEIIGQDEGSVVRAFLNSFQICHAMPRSFIRRTSAQSWSGRISFPARA